MRWRLALPVAGLVLAGCGTEDAAAPRPTETSVHLTTPSAVPTDETGLADVVAHPKARINVARVRPLGDGFRVAIWWRCVDLSCPRPHDVLAVSDDGFESVEFMRNPFRRLDEVMAPSVASSQGHVPALEGLMQWRLPSLARDQHQLAVLGGGDGATLFPFEKAARSTDGGDSWTAFPVTHPDGVMSYVAGGVLLSDSRLATLVTHWSDDKVGRPSDRPRGLMVSAGDDWSRFTPLKARFTPALTSPEPPWSPIESIDAMAGEQPVIWVTTSDNRLYVSVDDARTFQAIPAR